MNIKFCFGNTLRLQLCLISVISTSLLDLHQLIKQHLVEKLSEFQFKVAESRPKSVLSDKFRSVPGNLNSDNCISKTKSSSSDQINV